MNCAHHADQPAVAYCRTCGKALCANCTRPVRGVIYCEDCLGARMEATRLETPSPQPTVYQPVMDQGLGMKVPPPPVPLPPGVPTPSGPNPTVAGILAGFFPFGVGAVYSGQYAKGLAHLAIFGLLVAGCNAASNSAHGELLGVVCGVGLAFFWIYQIVDAVRSAKALQLGQPAPDPYGLAATFGAGTKIETSKVPIGAIILIILGVLFLLNTMGFELGLDRFWPLILIVVGLWLFARNYGLLGAESKEARLRKVAKLEERMVSRGYSAAMQEAIASARCQCARCCSRRLMGPAVLVTLGVLFLLENLGKVGFGRTWPILLLVIGGVKLFQNSASTEGHIALPPPGPPAPPADIPPPPTPPAPPVAPSEVNRG